MNEGGITGIMESNVKYKNVIERFHTKYEKELTRKTSSFISLGIHYEISIFDEMANQEFFIDSLVDHLGERPATLVGGPGEGKSTLMLKLAVLLSEKTDNDLVPVFINCGLLKTYSKIIESIHLNELSDIEKEELLQTGKLLVIFDGVNESEKIPTNELIRDIYELSELYPNCKYIVTCRSLEYPIWADSYFDKYSIMPVGDTQIRDQFVKVLGSEYGERYYSDLTHSTYNDLLGLCSNPLLLSLVIKVVSHNIKKSKQFSFSKIRGKSDIYKQFCESLKEHQLKKKIVDSNSRFAVVHDNLFCTLAFYMQANNKVYIEEDDLENVIRNMPYKKGRESDFISELARSSGIWYSNIVTLIKKSSFVDAYEQDSITKTAYSYIHQSFQEYFAGCYLVSEEHLDDNRYVEYLLDMRTKRNWDTVEFASEIDSKMKIIQNVIRYAVLSEDADALILASRCILGNNNAKCDPSLVGDCCIWMLDAFKYWNVPYKYELIYAAARLLPYVDRSFPIRLKADITYFSDKYSGGYFPIEYPETFDFNHLKNIIQIEPEQCVLNAVYTLGTRKWDMQDTNVVKDYLFGLLTDSNTSVREQAVKSIKSLLENNKQINIGETMFDTLLHIAEDKQESARIRTYTLNTIAEIGNSRAIKVFMDYLLDKSNPYRDSASWSLQELVVNSKDLNYTQEYMRNFYYQCLIYSSA